MKLLNKDPDEQLELTPKRRVLKNYVGEATEIMTRLVNKGYVIDNKDDIYQYDLFQDKYGTSSIVKLTSQINKIMNNAWDIEDNVKIIHNIAKKILPVVNQNEVDRYKQYKKAKANLKDEKELKKLKKELFNRNKSKKKGILNGGRDSPVYQSQALINNDIFYENFKYFEFNKDTNAFEPINIHRVHEILKKEFGITDQYLFKHETRHHMQHDYHHYITNGNGVISQWNANEKYKHQLNTYEDDYNKIMGIINKYE